MRIRFDHPGRVLLDFQPGDELIVSTLTPALDGMLRAVRLDGATVAHLIPDDSGDDVAVVAQADDETAVIGQGRRRARSVRHSATLAG